MGPPAPWAERAPARVSVEQIRRAFASFTPPPGPTGDGGRPAAVLCPLFEEGGEAWVVLTRRSSSLRVHTGEVAFPGGRLDPGEDLVSAACREAYEEVGIDPGSVEIIGRLSTVSTFLHPSLVTPFVAVLRGGRPAMVANPAEVERIITVPVAELFADEVHHTESWDLAAHGPRSFYFFDLVGDTVWGATGRMVRELLEVIWAAAPRLS